MFTRPLKCIAKSRFLEPLRQLRTSEDPTVSAHKHITEAQNPQQDQDLLEMLFSENSPSMQDPSCRKGRILMLRWAEECPIPAPPARRNRNLGFRASVLPTSAPPEDGRHRGHASSFGLQVVGFVFWGIYGVQLQGLGLGD